MQDVEVSIITRSEELPAIASRNFFHSKEFFLILEKTPGCSPYMCLCTDEHGIVQAHILAVVYRRGSWVPPYIYSHARIYGEGEYRDVETKDELFGRMLIMLTKFFRRRLCLYIEFSNLGTKMFGYKHLRRMGYTPVRWLQVHNSLHSKPPKERLSDKMLRKVEACEKQGKERAAFKYREKARGARRAGTQRLLQDSSPLLPFQGATVHPQDRDVQTAACQRALSYLRHHAQRESDWWQCVGVLQS